MSDELQSIGVSAAVLGVAALIALFLTITRTPVIDPDPKARRRLIGLVALVIALQCAHFAEEFFTGFYLRFPAMFGVPPMSASLFVWFNLSWIGVWILSVFGLALRIRAAFFPIWFLGIATAINGVAHPLLAISEGSYFPGLWTSPVVGVAGVVLLRGLTVSTRRC